ncbi:MAG: nucleoside 2-deoxyribosyltransferase [Candidatus Gastranaerophilales bacterium]|nr:nucleoside 2-deoxyribosyltransferase [Candidatus Gastranaerophilales bacterium]
MKNIIKCPICASNCTLENIESCGIYECEKCGRFHMNHFDNEPILSEHDKLVLKHYFTKLDKNDKRRLKIIDNNNLKEIIESIDYPKNLVEKVNGVLKYFAENTTFYSKKVIIDDISHICRLLFCVHEEEFRAIIQYLCDNKYLYSKNPPTSSYSFQLRMEGLKYYEEIIVPKLKSQQGFVAMWFNNQEDSAKFIPDMQKIYSVAIKPAIENDERFLSLKIDNKEHSNDINDEMISEIRKSRFVVADLTGYRGGVYFEAGFAYGLGIPVIYTCHEKWLKSNAELGIEGVHFDLNHRNIILWNDNNLESFKNNLINRINATIV